MNTEEFLRYNTGVEPLFEELREAGFVVNLDKINQEPILFSKGMSGLSDERDNPWIVTCTIIKDASTFFTKNDYQVIRFVARDYGKEVLMNGSLDDKKGLSVEVTLLSSKTFSLLKSAITELSMKMSKSLGYLIEDDDYIEKHKDLGLLNGFFLSFVANYNAVYKNDAFADYDPITQLKDFDKIIETTQNITRSDFWHNITDATFLTVGKKEEYRICEFLSGYLALYKNRI